MKNIKIAVDGFSSCGKSTLAKQLAAHFGFVFIDSGAMYRAVTLFAIENNIISEDDVVDINKLKKEIKNIKITFQTIDGKNHTFLNGKDVETEIRQIRVSKRVSIIATLDFVREEMVNLQRNLSEENSVIMDGRDIGTVVFPNAELKLFVTATPEVRAQRRYDELKAKGEDVNFDEIKANLINRDRIDSTREIAPLKQADDAVVLDNSNMTREQQFDFAVKLIEKILA
ncbi:MAG: (d)CMP kinase [Bacteroidales bacterium]|nr:(d)CMP kinase [Bacteroidales bacterium]